MFKLSLFLKAFTTSAIGPDSLSLLLFLSLSVLLIFFTPALGQRNFGDEDTPANFLSSPDHSSNQNLNFEKRDDSAIVFPNGNDWRNASSGIASFSRKKKIPLHLYMKLSAESDTTKVFQEYVKNVVVREDDRGQRYLVNRNSGVEVTQGSGGRVDISPPLTIIPHIFANRNGGNPTRGFPMPIPSPKQDVDTIRQSAACQPEARTVEVEVNFDPHIVYFPRCVRVQRCGGCCATDILRCEPSETKPVKVMVNKMAYIGDGTTDEMDFLEQETITMEQHTKCECRCRVKREDCSVRQKYNEDECQCVCKNQAEYDNCMHHKHKIWDPSTCQCSCREIKDCNSGYIFNLSTCHCVLQNSSRSASIVESKRNRKRRNHPNGTSLGSRSRQH